MCYDIGIIRQASMHRPPLKASLLIVAAEAEQDATG